MTIDKNQISVLHEISVDDFIFLREQVKFQPLTVGQAKRILDHTTYIAVAVWNGKSIGLTRVLFDYGTDAYITDVIVHPECQGCGIGKLLVDDVLQFIRENATPGTKVACSLYANQGKEAFYEKMGFQVLPNGKYGHGMLLEL